MEKKLRKSPIVITLYVIAALLLIYACYTIGAAIAYIASYAAAYSQTPAIGEILAYVLQGAYQPIALAVLVFAAGKILNEVRALNPYYYVTEEELLAEKEAKKAAKSKTVETVEVVEETEEKADAEVKADASMKKAELLAIAEQRGLEVPAKATKADILEMLNK